MNRRHMMDDHHGRSVGRATLLVRAVDTILGTHTPIGGKTAGESAGESAWSCAPCGVMVKALLRTSAPRHLGTSATRSRRREGPELFS
jgi:hypothetical protein